MHLPNIFQKPEDKILSLKYKKTIDGQLTEKLIYFIQSASKKSSKIITYISGTVNSFVSGVLFKKALEEKAMAIVFDFDTSKTQELAGICMQLGLNPYILKRSSAYQKELAAYRLHKEKDIRNFYIRFVNYHLSIQADLMKAELSDTEDKSDRLTNSRPHAFYGHIMPFYSLYKTELYDLARLLKINSDAPDYCKRLDPVLFLLTEKQIKPEEIAQEYNLDLEWLKKLKHRIDKHNLHSAVSQFII